MISPEEFAGSMHGKIIPLLRRFGRNVSRRGQAAAITRVVNGWPNWAPAYKGEAEGIQTQRWEDDGGSVLPWPLRQSLQ
jgi:hypothetical protein